MSLRKTAIALKPKARAQTVDLLNALLADLCDLQSQTKQAHWNVRGPQFIMLHELFDKLAGEVEELIDPLAERITTLGGIAHGTVRAAAKNSRLKEFPTGGENGLGYLEALIERFAAAANAFREGIDQTAALGDTVSSDILTGSAGDLDKALWFLEAHRG